MIEHYHEFEPKFTLNVKNANTNNKKGSILSTLFGRSSVKPARPKLTVVLHCKSCGYRTSVTTDYEGDAIQIDGKPYFIPTDFFVYAPIELTDTSVKPDVEYTLLRSGLYLPKAFISESTIKKITELDKEFVSLPKTDVDSYEKFGPYKRRYNITAEQARMIVDELQRNGFKFDLYNGYHDSLVISIRRELESRSYFVAENFVKFIEKIEDKYTDKIDDVIFSFKGKWSLIGVAVFRQLLSDLEELKKRLRKADRIYTDDSMRVTSTLPDGERPLFVGSNGDVILAQLGSVDRGHEYIVKYIELDGTKVAVTYTLNHSVKFDRQIANRLAKGELTRFGRAMLYCTKCKTTTFEIPVEEKIPVSIISIDGELYYVRRDTCSSLKSVNDSKEKIEKSSDLVPEVEYVDLGSDIYAPKGYIPDDVIEKLADIKDYVARARILTDELIKRGFKFFVRDTYYGAVVDVIGPNEYLSTNHVDYDCYERSYTDYTANKNLYRGKWGLLGRTILIATRGY